MMQAFLFDLDGTLIKSADVILETYKEVIKKMFNEDCKKEEITDFLGYTLNSTFQRFSSDEKVIENAIFEYREISKKKYDEKLEAYPYALSTLKNLKKKGKVVGVVTSKARELAKYHLKITGLLDYVDFVVGYEDVKLHKPNPDPILKGLELAKTKASETIYVGDHENDIKAAKKANVFTCAVSYSYRLKELLAESPDYVVDKLGQLKDV